MEELVNHLASEALKSSTAGATTPKPNPPATPQRTQPSSVLATFPASLVDVTTETDQALLSTLPPQSVLKLAAEELAIVDAEMIGSDAHRQIIIASSTEDPIKTADDIESHRSQTAEIAQFAADVGKLAKAVKGKAGFIGAALGSVYSVELLAGDEERARLKDRKQPSLFPSGKEEA